MKKLILIIILLAVNSIQAQSSGSLDTSFNSTGKKIINYDLGTIPPLGQGDESSRAIHIYTDNSMLVAGHAYYSNSQDVDMAVTKVLANGNIDTTWGNNGQVTVFFDLGGDKQDFINDIQVYPNGKILLIGYVDSSAGDHDFALARLNANGTLDNSFSDDGKMTIFFDMGGSKNDEAYSAYAFSSAIYVTGIAAQTTGSDFAVTKILDNGLIDTNFASSGRLSIDFANSSSSNDTAYKFFISETNGFWVLGKTEENDGSFSPAMAKIDYAGVLDNTFSSDGKFVFSDSRAGVNIFSVAKKTNADEFVFVGLDSHPENNDKDDCALAYINTSVLDNSGEPVADTFNISLDPSPLIFDFNSSCTNATFSTTDSKLVLSGLLYTDDWVTSHLMVVTRLNSINVYNGSSSHSIDTAFGMGYGSRGISFDDGTTVQNSISSTLAIDYNKNVIIVGNANINGVDRTAMAKLVGNGGLDPTVLITAPAASSQHNQGDSITFTGTATDPEDGNISQNIKWSSSIDGDIATGASVTTSSLSTGIHLVFANISDSDQQSNSAYVAVEIIELQNAPVVIINTPLNNTSFLQGVSVSFSATASDDEDGTITQNIVWSSSIDAGLGTGGNLSISNLSLGTHTIMASITDSNGQSDSHQISVTIQQNPDVIFKNGFEL